MAVYAHETTVVVPSGWQREVEGAIVYYMRSQTVALIHCTHYALSYVAAKCVTHCKSYVTMSVSIVCLLQLS